MAREVVIRIIDEGAPEAMPTPQADAPEENAPKPNASKKKETTLGDLLWSYVGKRAIDRVMNEAEYFAGKYFSVVEDYKTQEMVQNAKSMIQTSTSLAFSAFAGAKAFTSIGKSPVAGGVISAAVFAAGTTLSKMKEYLAEAEKMTQSAYGNYFHAERAGLIYGGHGTED